MEKPLRVLLTSCNPNDPALEWPVFLALKNLGYEVETCDATLKPFGSRFIFKVCRRLFKGKFTTAWNKIMQISSRYTQARVLNAARSFRPDIFLAIKAKEVEVKTIEKLHNMGITTANWYMEGLWNKSLFHLAPAYDFFFIMDEYTVSVLREQGMSMAHYLPVGTRLNASEIKSLPVYERIYNISFIGTPNPLREQVLGKVADLGLNIWGPAEWEKTVLKKFYRGRAYGPDLDDIYRKTRVVVNCHNPEAKTTGPILRDFEAMSNGALLVSNYQDGLAEEFIEDKELVFYRDINELGKLVSHYLENQKMCSDIAKAGQIAVFAKHTIENRVHDMLKIINNRMK